MLHKRCGNCRHFDAQTSACTFFVHERTPWWLQGATGTVSADAGEDCLAHRPQPTKGSWRNG